MGWQIILFNWAGFIVCMMILLTALLSCSYWLWNRTTKELSVFIKFTFFMINFKWAKRRLVGKPFKAKDGKMYKIVKVEGGK